MKRSAKKGAGIERRNLFKEKSAHQEKRNQQKDYSNQKKIVFSF
jgi:hypothetical protein